MTSSRNTVHSLKEDEQKRDASRFACFTPQVEGTSYEVTGLSTKEEGTLQHTKYSLLELGGQNLKSAPLRLPWGGAAFLAGPGHP